MATHPLARPAFPLQPASQNSSAFQSYNSSASSLGAPSPASSAPLPSPSANQQPQEFFGGRGGQQPQQAQQQPAQPPQAHPVFEYQPNRQDAGATAAETSNYLSQMGLLAEAAKRAEMAVVLRDLDSMEL